MSAKAAAKGKTKGVKLKAHGRPAVQVPAGTAVLLSKAHVAAVLDVTTRHVDSMIAAGAYPKPDLYIGVHPRWRQATHNAWDAAQRPDPPSKE